MKQSINSMRQNQTGSGDLLTTYHSGRITKTKKKDGTSDYTAWQR